MFHRQATTRGMLAAGIGMGISSAKNGNTSPPFGQVPPLVLLLGYKWHLSKTVLNPATIIISHVRLCVEKKVVHAIPFDGLRLEQIHPTSLRSLMSFFALRILRQLKPFWTQLGSNFAIFQWVLFCCIRPCSSASQHCQLLYWIISEMGNIKQNIR